MIANSNWLVFIIKESPVDISTASNSEARDDAVKGDALSHGIGGRLESLRLQFAARVQPELTTSGKL